jgi:hypothetical protein
MIEAGAGLRQTVDRRSLDDAIAVTAQMIGAVLIGDDE